MRKVFISYRHNAHHQHKEIILQLNRMHNLFIDKSIDSGDIPDHYSDERIRQIIRDEKLKDSTITLFLHGKDTNKRKFIDWELAGSMINYNDSYKNAIIIIDLDNKYALSANNTEEEDVSNTTNTFIKVEPYQKENIEYWRSKLPYAPERILINLTRDSVNINVMHFNTFYNNPKKLANLIEKVYSDRIENDYDTSIKLKRRNS